jgi:hypothetical protein
MTSTTYLVNSNVTANPGGVELEYGAMLDFLKKFGVRAITATSQEILVHAIAGDVVYIQAEGRLSTKYRDWAESLLNRDVVIIEKNTFALPSRFRPKHKNYRMILMSRDGGYRYSLRSALVWNRQKMIFVVPNLFFNQEGSEVSSLRQKNISKSSLRILRVGRPDINKWTTLEVEKFEDIFGRDSLEQSRLTLVGAPAPIVYRANHKNVGIDCFPYTRSVGEYYRTNDVYFLYSRIGETFGNTIFEAAEHGMRIVYIFNLKWDCAPIEYLMELGIESKIFEVSKSSKLSDSDFRPVFTKYSLRPSLEFERRNREFFLGNYKNAETKCPGVVESIFYICNLGFKYDVRLVKVVQTLIIEIFRESFLMKLIRRAH